MTKKNHVYDTFMTANKFPGMSQNFLYYYKQSFISKHQFAQSKTYSLLSKSNFDTEDIANTQTTPLPRAHQWNPFNILLQKTYTGIQESFHRLKSIICSQMQYNTVLL